VNRLRDLATAETCPYCGAEPSQPCEGERGQARRSHHEERLSLAELKRAVVDAEKGLVRAKDRAALARRRLSSFAPVRRRAAT